MTGTKKLTDLDAVAILKEIDRGVSGRELAKRYGVSDTTISQIKGGTRRKNASFMSKLTDAEVIAIREALACGFRAADLARAYGVTPVAIHHIKTGARKPNGTAVRAVEPNVWLSLAEAEALLNHLDACQYWMTNHSLERENEELALMLQRRIDGEKK